MLRADESRSARSGLIRGLRGLAPFDGTRFPPLPWGGTRVADADIAFIADWIDDGCCRTTASLTIDLGTLEAKGVQGHAAEGRRRGRVRRQRHGRQALRLSRGRAAPAPEPRLPERARGRPAARRVPPIYDLDKRREDRRNYNNQALIHQNHCQHGWERFLPWHRAYLYEFEQNLQDFRTRHHAPVLGLDDAAVPSGRSGPTAASSRGRSRPSSRRKRSRR